MHYVDRQLQHHTTTDPTKHSIYLLHLRHQQQNTNSIHYTTWPETKLTTSKTPNILYYTPFRTDWVRKLGGCTSLRKIRYNKLHTIRHRHAQFYTHMFYVTFISDIINNSRHFIQINYTSLYVIQNTRENHTSQTPFYTHHHTTG